jgi:DNA-binding NarL/FixJ family response regulator
MDGMKVIIIDDHELFAEGLRLLMAQLTDKANVTIRKSCEEVLLDPSLADTDLVLLDYNLQGVSGLSYIERLRSFFDHARIVMVSSEDSRMVINEAIAAGSFGYIPKSSSSEVLIGALRVIMMGGIYLPPQALEQSVERIKEDAFSGLSNRQREVFDLIVKGFSNKQIANKLNIAEGTVKAHASAIYEALNVRSRAEVIVVAAKIGYIAIT